MKDVDVAKNLLVDDKTCVLVLNDKIIERKERGIMPIMALLQENFDLQGYSVADRIVGKAAAYLFVYAGIKEVYSEVISESGIEVLEKYHIPYSYGTKTDVIINRKGDDICPMEKTVKDIDEPSKAYEALKEKVAALKR